MVEEISEVDVWPLVAYKQVDVDKLEVNCELAEDPATAVHDGGKACIVSLVIIGPLTAL